MKSLIFGAKCDASTGEMPRHPFFLGEVTIGLIEDDQNQTASGFKRAAGLIRSIGPKADIDQRTRDDIAVLGPVEADGNIRLMPVEPDGAQGRAGDRSISSLG
jgi:hypothetical protein